MFEPIYPNQFSRDCEKCFVECILPLLLFFTSPLLAILFPIYYLIRVIIGCCITNCNRDGDVEQGSLMQGTSTTTPPQRPNPPNQDQQLDQNSTQDHSNMVEIATNTSNQGPPGYEEAVNMPVVTSLDEID